MMSVSKNSAAAILISNFFIIAAIAFCFFYATCNGICLKDEKQALLLFKKDLKDHSGRLSSWIPEVDCCKWEGILCNNVTGHVTELRLRNFGAVPDPSGEALDYVDYQSSTLSGKINPSLLNLKYLCYLDLSHNDFGGTPIPSFIGSLENLEYLNFSRAGFRGIPHHLGNLSNLQTLDLRGAGEVHNLHWLAGLSSLENLDMSQVNVSQVSSWLNEINMVPSLRKLYLSGCGLVQIPHLNHLNFSSLTVLDLSSNDFKSTIPRWVFGLSNLQFLDLSSSNFEGQLPKGPWNLTSLRHLNFASGNSLDHSLSGNLPKELFSLNNLVYLDLRGNRLLGPLPEGIQNLSALETLDVSGNLLSSFLPHELFTHGGLVTLALSDNSFSGPIPSNLGNSTKLKYFDISGNRFNSSIPNGLYKCKSLETLGFRGNQLQGEISSDIANLSSLTEMDFAYNAITELPREIGKLCKIERIDLSENGIKGSISELIDGMSQCFSYSIKELYLSENYLSGHLTAQLGELKNLQSLRFDGNSISGPIPSNLGKLSSLNNLYLNGNKLNGTLPKSLWQLSGLTALSVSDNMLEGEVTQHQLDNLTRLTLLHASRNSLILKVNQGWNPAAQFSSLRLGSWKLGSQFPSWLHSLKTISEADLSSTGISGSIPSWFWNFSEQIRFLNLSHNQLSGEISSIPGSEEMKSDPRLIFPIIPGPLVLKSAPRLRYLSGNQFSGPLPRIGSNAVTELDLYNNSFSGNISSFLCNVEEVQRLEILNLGQNLLSGEIPNCWMNWPSLKVINLANNNLTGSIPRSIGHLKYLKSLDLHNNSLFGQIPLTLKNCTGLLKVDLGQNHLSGNAPAWLGSSLSRLRILILRSNKFHGDLSPEICFLNILQILDFAENNISGKIPSCFKNFTAMTGKIIALDDEEKKLDYSYYVGVYKESASVSTKGNKYKYDTILALFTSMDLANNIFSGEIPEELTRLVGLRSLNLSGNHLRGKIPNKIGDMKVLESLDLSRNLLSGEIPPSISGLSFLNSLNLSYNNLSGRIPLSTQMQSFNASSFAGNKLCGLPLENRCSSEDVPVPDKDTEESEVNWLYIFMALGYAVGIWGMCGILVFKRSWRHAYFRFVDNVWNKLCLFCLLMFRRFWDA